MPIYSDFPLARYEDGVLTIVLTPPEPIGGKTIEFVVAHRFGGDPFVTKSVASGYNAVSGIEVTDSGAGVMSIPLFGTVDLSGQPAKNYAWECLRVDSGYRTIYAQGYVVLGASTGT